MHVHFWTRRPEATEQWDPDTQPDRHLNGFGHGLLEIHARLDAAGKSVSLGPRVPAQTTLVVVSHEDMTAFEPRILDRMAAHLGLALLRRRRMPGVAVVRVDISLNVEPPKYTTLELMPTRASTTHPRQIWLPMLPQRGLRPRDRQRGEVLTTVALKAYSENVPPWLDGEFSDRLEGLGYRLRIDDERSGRWQDFEDVDVVLCTHQAATLHDDRRKPATKLINAWRAGAIPICGDYVGYRELASADETALFVEGEDAESYLHALARLRDEPGLAVGVRAALPTDQYAPELIVEQYWRAFQDAPRARRSIVAREAVVALVRVVRRKTTNGLGR